MLYQLSYASTLKPSKNSRTSVRIASAVGARGGPPLWIILTPFPPRHWTWYQYRLLPVKSSYRTDSAGLPICLLQSDRRRSFTYYITLLWTTPARPAQIL